MKERKYPLSLFVMGFVMNMFLRYVWLFIPGVILLLAGIFIKWCLYAGITLLIIDIVVSFIEQMKMRHIMLSESDDEQFRKFQDAVSDDGNVFENIRSIISHEMDSFMGDMCDLVCEKCEYGDAIDKLNEHERVFFVTQILEQEVNNGGFSQFFYNSSGDYSNELVDAFTKIGALKTAEICKKAVTVFNGKVPADRDERAELLDSLNCDDILSECDDAFYNYEDNLESLNHKYIMKYREFFD